MFQPFVPFNRVQRTERQEERTRNLVEERNKARLAKQQYLKNVYELSVAGRRAQAKAATGQKKVIIAANRLPVTLKRDPVTKEWSCSRSAGGLVSGLRAVRGFDMTWIGWAGVEVSQPDQPAVAELLERHNCYPVWLTQEHIDLYYNGFANNVIWPLFHYVSPPLPDRGVNEQGEQQWECYQRVNQMFVDAVCGCHEDGDFVWVHDYHLMLMPKLLREVIPKAKIGWFLHIPFPAAELYRMMKVREELLYGLLSANLVAFHVFISRYFAWILHIIGFFIRMMENF